MAKEEGMRNRFDEQLAELNKEIIEMGSMCEEVIDKATKAINLGDVQLAKTVKESGASIDQMETKTTAPYCCIQ